jgi:hypothetical protein
MKNLKDIVLERLILSKNKNSITPVENFLDILREYKRQIDESGFAPEYSDTYGETGIIPQTKDGNDVLIISTITTNNTHKINLYYEANNEYKVENILVPENFDYFIKDVLGLGNRSDGEKFYELMIAEIEEKLNK